MNLMSLLREEKEKNSWTIAQMSDMTGINDSAISEMLSKPNSRDYGLNTLQKLADGLNIPLYRLIEAMGYVMTNYDTSQESILFRQVLATYPEIAEVIKDYGKLESQESRTAVAAVLRSLLETQGNHNEETSERLVSEE